MITLIDWSSASPAERAQTLARPTARMDPALRDQVRRIVEEVKAEGRGALARWSMVIDGSAPELIGVARYAEEARKRLTHEDTCAIQLAKANIERFHQLAGPKAVSVDVAEGINVTRVWRLIERVGLYIPGGRAPLFSTLLMLAIPARVAGVGMITVATPPRPDGGLDPVLALAAETCGIEAVWAVGGAQAIAAMAFGAGDIGKVDKIFGPGNSWVSAAKSLVSTMPGGPAIDLPAGPSELIVIADDSADPATVAIDLLAQAEHGPDAQAILITTSRTLAERVRAEITRQAETIGGEFAPVRSIICKTLQDAVSLANEYAPEHLSLAVEQTDELIGIITSAGAVFVGHAAAESFGDYLIGPSHVLPTDGAARFIGGVSTASFMKTMTIQRVSRSAAEGLARPTALLARLEGLEAHARSAEARA